MDIEKKYPHLFEFSNLKTTPLPIDAIEKAKKLISELDKQHHKKKFIATCRNWQNN